MLPTEHQSRSQRMVSVFKRGHKLSEPFGAPRRPSRNRTLSSERIVHEMEKNREGSLGSSVDHRRNALTGSSLFSSEESLSGWMSDGSNMESPEDDAKYGLEITLNTSAVIKKVSP